MLPKRFVENFIGHPEPDFFIIIVLHLFLSPVCIIPAMNNAGYIHTYRSDEINGD